MLIYSRRQLLKTCWKQELKLRALFMLKIVRAKETSSKKSLPIKSYFLKIALGTRLKEMLNKNCNEKPWLDWDNRYQWYVVWIFFMETDLYLIKLERWKKENRITWDYINIQCTTKNVKVTRCSEDVQK